MQKKKEKKKTCYPIYNILQGVFGTRKSQHKQSALLDTKLPWVMWYPLANQMLLHEASASHEPKCFHCFSLLSGIFGNFSHQGVYNIPYSWFSIVAPGLGASTVVPLFYNPLF